LSVLRDPRLVAIGERLREVRAVVPFLSSKGGVGKTLVSVATALALGRRGLRVGLLDLDVTNPTVHVVLGIRPGSLVPREEYGVVPPEVSGVRVMSTVFYTLGRPAPLRGEGVSSAIRELLSITRWGPLDVLVVDTPPGMSDELLELLTYIRRFSSFLVTTPSRLSLDSTTRLAELVAGRVAGVVLNMAWEVPEEAVRLADRLSAPLYVLPYDSSVEVALGSPERLAETRFARAVDGYVAEHIVRLLQNRR
jgi:ATP-binding protein involved in chromosome partitioning